MDRIEGEVFQRLAVEFGREDSFDIMVMVDHSIRELSIDSRYFHYHVRIPDGGFTYFELDHISYLLSIGMRWLVRTLSNSRFEGIAGITVRNMQMWYDAIAMPVLVEEPPPSLPPTATPSPPASPSTPWRFNSLASVPGDETCAICLETGAENPLKGWSSVEGCSAHKFHTDCIQGWAAAGTCPMCRTPWTRNTRRRLQ